MPRHQGAIITMASEVSEFPLTQNQGEAAHNKDGANGEHDAPGPQKKF